MTLTLRPIPADGAQPDAYRAFLEAKFTPAAQAGFEVDPAEFNPALSPHVKVAVDWALRGGRRLLALRFGLQKTALQLELMRLTARRVKSPAGIVLPLGARLSFFDDAREFFTGAHAVKLAFVREDSEIDPHAINLTNTESVREGKIDPRRFGCTTFDEGDILRNMATKTFWKFTERAKEVEYRHVATATPDPQAYDELLAYAAYLDVMDVGQGRTRFFKRNSEKADALELLPHKADEFWAFVASWALFLQKPSDLSPSFSDEGYDLPKYDMRWHEVGSPSSAAAGADRDGQLQMFRDTALGLGGTAAEKRDTLGDRIAKLNELRAEMPDAHRIIWHQLEDERRAIEKAAPACAMVYGAQSIEKNEAAMISFAKGEIQELGGKPSMIGSGPNFQKHCWWSIIFSMDWKFKDLIQAMHRTARFGQRFDGFPAGVEKACRFDILYTEAEREMVRRFKENLARYEEQQARMTALIRQYGLSHLAVANVLKRSMDVERREIAGERYRIVNNDCIDEAKRLPADSIDLVCTSLPFSTQYEYTPSYRDFGHTDDDPHFFAQMDFLTPELLRALKPGRNAVVHCKDRIIEGSRSGLGFQTVSPFGWRVLDHFQRHGFAYLGTTFLITDVVKENKQTNRLGFAEQCKDGTRMGFGLAEYLHVFRKPQTDKTRGYADEPVVKKRQRWDRLNRQWIVDDPWTEEPTGDGDGREPYTVGRWQLDASGNWRSNGNRLLTPAEISKLPVKGAFRAWRAHCVEQPYDHRHHIEIVDAMTEVGTLRPDFEVAKAHGPGHPDVWTDIARMRSLNTLQVAKNKEKHLCPLPIDIVERVIAQRSMAGETVLDPFGGLMTVPYCAVRMGRRGVGFELSETYFKDGASYCEAAEREATAPTLFHLLEAAE